MKPNFSWIDRAFLKEYFLKPLLFSIVIVGVLFTINKFTYFNFSIGSNQSYNQFEVIGTGKVATTANIATTTYTITETAKTEEEARGAANAKQNESLSEIKKLGISEKDIKTVGFYVNPNYEYEEQEGAVEPLIYPPARQVQNGYIATVTTEIKSSEIEKINKAIDAVTTIGATVGGVSYTLDDEEKYKLEATNKAIEQAKLQAKDMAKTAGFKLGNVVSIRNVDDQYGYPQPYAAEANLKSQAPDTSTNLQTGENEITVRIGVTYQIKN